MCRAKLVRLAIVGLAVATLAPRAAFAQAVISGVVKDASGAVLPGVTVEAASPVLIEKVKSAVTNDTGQYRIVDLRPGSYDVTFTLTGFSSVKREGVELAGTATATINADLKVGSVEETITVTGAAPLVDVQGTETERSISHELLDSVPTSRTIHAVATLIPGLSVQGGSGNPNVADVGGSALGITPQASIHGSAPNDQRLLMEGLPLQAAAGNNTDFQVNMGSIQELTIDTAGGSAEEFSGGVRLNIIPREGGNLFRGSLFVDGAGPALQTSNYTDRLAAAGFPKPNPLKPLLKTYNFNPAFGGPIKRDKLWFFAAVNRTRNTTVIPVYPNLNVGNPAAWTYVANPNGEYSNIDILFYGENGRLTWQATPKNKFAFYHDTQVRCSCPQGSAAQAPEAQPSRYLPVARFTSLSYTAPISNRLVFDASALYRYDGIRTSGAMNLSPSIISVVDNGLDLTYRNYGSEANENVNRNYNVRGSISFVTGAHSLKAGFQTERTKNQSYQNMNDSQTRYRFTNGVPNQITLFADPRSFEIRGRDIDLFIQDRWTVKRFTFTGGLRYDDYKTSFPDQSLGPVPLAPTRNVSFPAADGARIRDITPRMGVAYDVFGNGRTAVRASM
ncbi:MAG: carboxypeptidase regulatory-like domain-containing protein, partial [Acidobacteriota bacterium]